VTARVSKPLSRMSTCRAISRPLSNASLSLRVCSKADSCRYIAELGTPDRDDYAQRSLRAYTEARGIASQTVRPSSFPSYLFPLSDLWCGSCGVRAASA
jgi:hypothetical protein